MYFNLLEKDPASEVDLVLKFRVRWKITRKIRDGDRVTYNIPSMGYMIR